MLINAKKLRTYRLLSKDGEIGTAGDFYFDDEHWTVRYLVVSTTGNWMTGKQVLLSPYALKQVPENSEHIHINLTKKQIEESPSLESDKPVSRQFEESYYGYYEWPMYWGGPFKWGVYPQIVRDAKMWDLLENSQKKWDPHLNSIQDVTGYDIEAKDGDMGRVEDFIIDTDSWTIRYFIVDTQSWWPGKKVLISPQWTNRVSWDEKKISVDFLKEAIRQSQEYTEKTLLNREYEAELHQHYGYLGYWLDEQYQF